MYVQTQIYTKTCPRYTESKHNYLGTFAMQQNGNEEVAMAWEGTHI